MRPHGQIDTNGRHGEGEKRGVHGAQGRIGSEGLRGEVPEAQRFEQLLRSGLQKGESCGA